MASKPKVTYETLLTYQTAMEETSKQSSKHAENLKNTIKRQPLCPEAITELEHLQLAANMLQRLVTAYMRELATVADIERGVPTNLVAEAPITDLTRKPSTRRTHTRSPGAVFRRELKRKGLVVVPAE
jgi:DNA-binding TFAR19-related protein (PDSD5 family)